MYRIVRTFKDLLNLKRDPTMFDFCCDRHDQDGIKVCSKCKRLLTLDSFYTKKAIGCRYSMCKDCLYKAEETHKYKNYRNKRIYELICKGYNVETIIQVYKVKPHLIDRIINTQSKG